MLCLTKCFILKAVLGLSDISDVQTNWLLDGLEANLNLCELLHLLSFWGDVSHGVVPFNLSKGCRVLGMDGVYTRGIWDIYGMCCIVSQAMWYWTIFHPCDAEFIVGNIKYISIFYYFSELRHNRLLQSCIYHAFAIVHLSCRINTMRAGIQATMWVAVGVFF